MQTDYEFVFVYVRANVRKRVSCMFIIDIHMYL